MKYGATESIPTRYSGYAHRSSKTRTPVWSRASGRLFLLSRIYLSARDIIRVSLSNVSTSIFIAARPPIKEVHQTRKHVSKTAVRAIMRELWTVAGDRGQFPVNQKFEACVPSRDDTCPICFVFFCRFVVTRVMYA